MIETQVKPVYLKEIKANNPIHFREHCMTPQAHIYVNTKQIQTQLNENRVK